MSDKGNFGAARSDLEGLLKEIERCRGTSSGLASTDQASTSRTTARRSSSEQENATRGSLDTPGEPGTVRARLAQGLWLLWHAGWALVAQGGSAWPQKV